MNAKRRFWTEPEIQLLKEHYPHKKTQDVAQMLGMSVSSTYNKAHSLGLKKTSEYLNSEDSGRLSSGDSRGGKTRFAKGQISWNKGMKGLQIGGKETQFKANHLPHNSLPIGSYRITKDGLLQRKVSNQSGSNSKRWRSVHELVWIAENGKVPDKHIVVFRDGMNTNILDEITINKLECITRAENMRRNTIHNYPKEIAAAVLMRGALNRRITHEQNNR